MRDDNQAERREDKAYRNGYMQAWREWSACIDEDCKISEANLRKMRERRADMGKRAQEDG